MPSFRSEKEMVMVPKNKLINNNAAVIKRSMTTCNIKELRTVKFTQSFYNTSIDAVAVFQDGIF